MKLTSKNLALIPETELSKSHLTLFMKIAELIYLKHMKYGYNTDII